MPIDSKIVGASTAPVTASVDARWTMAYAAGLADTNPAYLDTAAGTVIAHPLYPVCLEWPVILASRALPGTECMTPEEMSRGVHAAHDLHIVRPIRAGERLTTRAHVIGLKAIRPGAAQMTRLDTVDESGKLVCRTFQLGISRGVEISGKDAALEAAPAPPQTLKEGGGQRYEIPVSALAAHVYTECARIWNPIHTDRRVALAAGLPDIILHGTATLALAVSRLVNELLGGDSTRVRRVGGRFAAMVLMPSTLTLSVGGWIAPGVIGTEPGCISFTVLTGDGQPAVEHGYLVVD